MRRIIKDVLLALFIAAVVGATIAPYAYADPPPQGWTGTLSVPSIVCNTRDQIVAISKAGESGGHIAVLAALQEFSKVIDTKGEPSCTVMPIPTVTFGASEDIGFSINAAEKRVKAWASPIGNAQGNWWVLFAEPDTPQATSCSSSFDNDTHTRLSWCV